MRSVEMFHPMQALSKVVVDDNDQSKPSHARVSRVPLEHHMRLFRLSRSRSGSEGNDVESETQVGNLLIELLSYLLTYLLTHLLTYSLTELLTYLLSYLLTY